jgi:hypothetical protein
MAATTALICRSGDRYERLLFALKSHFSKTIKRQLSALSEPSLNIRRLPVYKQCELHTQKANFKGGRMNAPGI